MTECSRSYLSEKVIYFQMTPVRQLQKITDAREFIVISENETQKVPIVRQI